MSPPGSPRRSGSAGVTAPAGCRIYVAGPMTGLPDDNRPAFNAAATRLRKAGYQVVNPAELDGDGPRLTRREYLRRDLPYLLTCDAVAVLPGWRESEGASFEVYVARWFRMPILDAETLQPVRETILEEAGRLVDGPRQADYGHPLDDFERTARIWTAILGIEVSPEQVGLCMIGVKLSRQCHQPRRDNLVDIAGYARTVELIEEELERQVAEYEGWLADGWNEYCAEEMGDTIPCRPES